MSKRRIFGDFPSRKNATFLTLHTKILCPTVGENIRRNDSDKREWKRERKMYRLGVVRVWTETAEKEERIYQVN